LDELCEGALDARKFPANIGKQHVCPGEIACVDESFQLCVGRLIDCNLEAVCIASKS
jgi:hypothetical protein